MTSRSARLLCVGKEPDLLQTRCAVLRHSGYGAQSATLPEAENPLRTEQVDLIVVSAGLNERERGRILAASGKTPVYVLSGLTLACDLLAQVKRRLPPVSSSTPT